jgi:hypothetical protein
LELLKFAINKENEKKYIEKILKSKFIEKRNTVTLILLVFIKIFLFKSKHSFNNLDKEHQYKNKLKIW